MLMDDEVARVGAEGLRAVAAAAEAFLGLLASKALSRAGGDKRKNFRFDDLLAVAKQDRRLGVMGLSDVLQRDPAFEEASWLGEGHATDDGKGLWAGGDPAAMPHRAQIDEGCLVSCICPF